LHVATFVRAVTTSLVGVLIGAHLARQGMTGAALGTTVSAGLVGGALAAVVATFLADHIGRSASQCPLAGAPVSSTLAY
jgi:TctA family transporter